MVLWLLACPYFELDTEQSAMGKVLIKKETA